MALYRKKTLIEAVQWFKLGDHPNVVPVPSNHPAWNCPEQAALCGWIKTLEGGSDTRWCTVRVGDWIATGTRGENWPINPSIFAETYELAE